jgi:methylenetetrahydrofolate dehydrogenase (NADP+)/methenyltetrahydrofolate cyclohydrolase
MLLLDYYKIEIEGKRVVVIGRSPILGKPIAMMLLNKNATVTIAHSKTKDLEKIVKESDVVVACVGKPKFVKSEWLKEGVVIVDAGYNPGNVGDVDLEGAAGVASAYTPVPGGVGPMTIASLLSQTVKSFEKRVNL